MMYFICIVYYKYLPMKKRLIPIVVLIIYGALLINLMVFKNMPFIRIGPLMFKLGGPHEGSANLVPFKTIAEYLGGQNGFMLAFINIAGNILLLVPVGFIIPFVYRGVTWKKMLVAAVACGLAIESMQALLHVGIFDIDDVILNGVGVMFGYWLFAVAAKIRWTRGKIIAITLTAALIVSAPVFYGFAFSPHRKLPVNAAFTADSLPSVNTDTGKVDFSRLPDPCSGTGGTGQIISVGKNTITIKQNNGTSKLIKITKQTKIKNAAGPLAATGLKAGDRVTVVIGLIKSDDSIASVILVCNQKKQ